MYNETHFSILLKQYPDNAELLLAQAEQGVADHWGRLLVLTGL